MIKIIRNKQNPFKLDLTFSSRDNFHAIKNIASSICGSWYHHDEKIWKIDLDEIDILLNKLMELKSEIVNVDLDIFKVIEKLKERKDDILRLRNSLEGVDCGIKLLKPYSLLPFQHVGVQFLWEVQNGLIADKVGLGKTLQGFCAAYKFIREGKAQKCFIVVPNSLKDKWRADIKMFLGLDTVIIEGLPLLRQERYEKWILSSDPFAIISYESLRNDYPRYMVNNIIHDFGVIFDEVQYLKNVDAKRSQVCKELVNNKFAKFRFGLSATYVETGLENLFGVMLVVDDNIFGKSYYRFAERYLKVNMWGRVDGYLNVQEVTQKMKYVAVRRHKDQVRSQLQAFLPKVNENTLWVDLTDDQKKVYNEVLAKVVSNIRDMEKADKISIAGIMAEMVYLRQVCVSTDLIDHNVSSSCKLETLLDILPPIVEDNKVVIFSFFTKFIDILKVELEKIDIKCMAMHGSSETGKKNKRADNVNKFKNDDSIRVLATSDILREGQDLQVASYIINVDILWNPASMIQRAGRIDRLNQKADNIYVINIWSKDTIEQEMSKRLYQREDLATQVMDDGYIEGRVKKLSFNDLKKMLRMI